MTEPQQPGSEDLSTRIKALRAELRSLEQPARDRKLRRGLAKPRNRREWDIFASDLLPDTSDDENAE